MMRDSPLHRSKLVLGALMPPRLLLELKKEHIVPQTFSSLIKGLMHIKLQYPWLADGQFYITFQASGPIHAYSYNNFIYGYIYKEA